MKNTPLRGMFKNKPFTSAYYVALIVLILTMVIMYFFGCTGEIPPQKNISAEISSYNKKLSDPSNNPLHLKAKKLNEEWHESKGEYGLDDIRYTTLYRYRVIPKSTFIWKNYRKYHPNDAVIADDNEYDYDKLSVVTNTIDKDVFSPITYVYK